MTDEKRICVTAENSLGIATFIVWQKPNETIREAFTRQFQNLMFPYRNIKKVEK